jgi:hypothetical protein
MERTKSATTRDLLALSSPHSCTQPASQEMLDLLQALRKKVVIGFVGGSNLVKQIEQLSVRGHDSE